MACSQIIYGFNARGACKIVGGVKTVYLTNSENITAVGTTGPSPVTQINSFTYATGGLWYEFNQIQETSSLTMTPNASVQNYSLFFEEILTLVFTNYNADLRYIVKSLAQNNLVAVVELRSGEFVYIGNYTGLDISGGEGGSGIAAGDRNGFSLTFRAIEPEAPLTLDPTFVESVDWTSKVSSSILGS